MWLVLVLLLIGSKTGARFLGALLSLAIPITYSTYVFTFKLERCSNTLSVKLQLRGILAKIDSTDAIKELDLPGGPFVVAKNLSNWYLRLLLLETLISGFQALLVAELFELLIYAN